MNVPLCFALFVIVPPTMFAQTPDPCATAPQTCATLINTRASDHLRIPNSAVDISLGITATDRDLPAVQRSLGNKTATLLKFLRAQQVQRLITTEVSFSPETKNVKNGPDKTVGYDGSMRVSFRTSPEKAPAILSGALSNGANDINSTVFTPTEDDLAAARRDLASSATRTAIAQADAIAKAAGMHVVSVRHINVENESTIYPRPVSMMARAMKVDSAPMPDIETSAGDQDVSLAVSITVAATR